MNRANLEQIFGRYVKRFPELNTGGHDEVYKWEIAAQFRPMIDRALAADDSSFPKRLVDVVQLTEQTIDNRYELSFYALSEVIFTCSPSVPVPVKFFPCQMELEG